MLIWVVSFAAVLASGVNTGGEGASFQGLGDLPGGVYYSVADAVSDDGRVVVGMGTSSTGQEAVYWQDGVTLSLDPDGGFFQSHAEAISGAGNAILVQAGGQGEPTSSYLWSEGKLTPSPVDRTNALSADGQVIVGTVSNDGGSDTVVWQNGSMSGIVNQPELWRSTANDVSADGSVVVGRMTTVSFDDAQAFRWTAEEGLNGWGEVPSHVEAISDVHAVSSDGLVAVGTGSSSERRSCLLWNQGTAISLGELPGGSRWCVANGVSAHGETVVGRARSESAQYWAAFIWDHVFGMRELRDVLEADHGLDLAGWILEEAIDISPDGRTIVGNGFNPDGDKEAWIARIPPLPTIVWSTPAHGTIDARQDLSVSGMTRQGIDRFRVTFSTGVRHAATGADELDALSFEIADLSGDGPEILDVFRVGGTPSTYEITLSDPIPPGAWTTLFTQVTRQDGLSSAEFGDRVVVGYLPGDVDGNGTVGALDILALIDLLNGVSGRVRPIESTDINRSGVANSQDVLRLIDLLNGVNSSKPWLRASLPEPP